MSKKALNWSLDRKMSSEVWPWANLIKNGPIFLSVHCTRWICFCELWLHIRWTGLEMVSKTLKVHQSTLHKWFTNGDQLGLWLLHQWATTPNDPKRITETHLWRNKHQWKSISHCICRKRGTTYYPETTSQQESMYFQNKTWKITIPWCYYWDED